MQHFRKRERMASKTQIREERSEDLDNHPPLLITIAVH